MDVINRSELSSKPIVRAEPGHLYLANGFFAGVVGLAIAVFITLERAKAGLTADGLLSYYGAILIGFGGAAFFMARLGLNLGISLGDEGVELYQKAPQQGKVIRNVYPWESLGAPHPNSAVVYFYSEDDPFFVCYNQARALVRDPRYPMRTRISPKARKRLGIEADHA
jgi:hypothetical protein